MKRIVAMMSMVLFAVFPALLFGAVIPSERLSAQVVVRQTLEEPTYGTLQYWVVDAVQAHSVFYDLGTRGDTTMVRVDGAGYSCYVELQYIPEAHIVEIRSVDEIHGCYYFRHTDPKAIIQSLKGFDHLFGR